MRYFDKFTDISGDLKQDFSRAEKILALNSPIMMFCVYVCMLAISWFGAQMVVASGNNPDLGLTTGQLGSMLTYTGQILSAFMMLSMVFTMLMMAKSPLQRCGEILGEEPDLSSPANAVTEIADGAFYLFIKSPSGDANEFCERAKKYEILMVPADSFGVEGYVRIAYCVSTDMIKRSLPKFRDLIKCF